MTAHVEGSDAPILLERRERLPMNLFPVLGDGVARPTMAKAGPLAWYCAAAPEGAAAPLTKSQGLPPRCRPKGTALHFELSRNGSTGA